MYACYRVSIYVQKPFALHGNKNQIVQVSRDTYTYNSYSNRYTHYIDRHVQQYGKKLMLKRGGISDGYYSSFSLFLNFLDPGTETKRREDPLRHFLGEGLS